MLPKTHRLILRGNTAFFSKAKVKHDKSLSLYWNTGSGEKSRGAVIVKQGCTRTNAEKNRIKRQLRAVLFNVLQSFPFPIDCALVFKGKARRQKDFPKNELKEKAEKTSTSFSQLQHHVQELFSNIGN